MIARGMKCLLLSILLLLSAVVPSYALEPRSKVEKEQKAAEAKAAEEAAKQAAETKENEDRESVLPLAVPGFRDQPEARDYQNVCGGLFITNQKSLALSTMERRLLCGDESGGQIGTPWSQIPPNQEAYFMKGFLQTRGYHHPEFVQDIDRLYVKTGPISTLKTLRLLGGPPGWIPPERRLVIGQPLTPALLNDTQTWALGLVKDEGYACAEDSVQADPDKGEVAVFFRLNDRKRIRLLEQTGDMGVNQNALNRYNAFVLDDWYKDRMVALTRRRTLDDGFLQTLVMTTKCGPGDEVTVVRDVSLGPPRTVRLGAGFSTDLGPLLQGVVRQSRIGESASSAQADLKLSRLNDQQNLQTLDANFRWYYLKGESRYSLNPTLQLKHEATEAHDLRSAQTELLHGWTFDTTEGRYDLRAGPGFIAETQTRSGPADHVINAAFVELGGRWTDHDFEWFNTSPRTGEYIDVTGLFAIQKLGSNFTGQNLRVTGEKLWTIGDFDPPLFILGTRFGFSTIFTGDNTVATFPNRFLTFLGGDADLRGYNYQSLPRSKEGALTGANASVEGRLHDVLFKVIDVFGFLDVGVLGSKGNAQFDQPIFWSPGFGFRWESPFGVLRTYLARRFATDQDPAALPYDKAFRVGVTFGEEF